MLHIVHCLFNQQDTLIGIIACSHDKLWVCYLYRIPWRGISHSTLHAFSRSAVYPRDFSRFISMLLMVSIQKSFIFPTPPSNRGAHNSFSDWEYGNSLWQSCCSTKVTRVLSSPMLSEACGKCSHEVLYWNQLTDDISTGRKLVPEKSLGSF